MSQYLSRKEAAAYLKQQGLRIEAGTLQKLACVGGGPEYALFGNKAVYTTPILDAWALRRLRQRSSSKEAA